MRIFASLLLATLAAAPAGAQDFWQGKTVTLLAGAPAGSDHDKLAKLVGKHLPNHLSGKPAITVDNRSSNNGVDALNAFYADAPKDGTALHLLMPGMALLQALGAPNAKYDAGKLAYVGNLSRAPQILMTWWVTGFKTIDDGRRREMALGAMGAASLGAVYPEILNAMLRTRFKTVTNYRREADMDEGMQNTEIGGRIASLGSVLATQPDWIVQKRIAVLTQIALARHPSLPDAPLLNELTTNDRDRALLTLVSRDAEHARALALPPGAPADRVEALRKAFDAMAKDEAFLAEARAQKLDVGVNDGATTAKAVADELGAPREVIERARSIVAPIFR
jgi:hypothetical protein